jgi:arsenate reductase
MKIYGIKTCSTVNKAKKYMRDREIEFEFIDLKSDPVDEKKILSWLEEVEIDLLFNKRGKKYRDLKLKELDLDREGKIAWMVKENYLLKRPIIEYKGGVSIGYDELLYASLFDK